MREREGKYTYRCWNVQRFWYRQVHVAVRAVEGVLLQQLASHEVCPVDSDEFALVQLSDPV